MKIDLYHLYRNFHFSSFVYPIILETLRLWSESIGWKVRVAVCKEQEVDFSSDADVVGISVYTQTAPAAYRVSDKLRARGKIVLLGGPHFRGPPTYREAISHCHAIVNSISEEQWQRLLKDIADGKILPDRQKARYIVDYKKHFRYPDNLYQSANNLKWYQLPSVPTSLGCPYSCTFCSPYLQGEYILRDIKTILDEAAHAKGKILFLSDATFGLNRNFTVDLMKRLAPLEIKMGVETALGRLKDTHLLDAMSLGGVKWIITGIESPSMRLKKHGSVNLKENLKKVIGNIHERGMFIQGNLICGLDSDGAGSFDEIYSLCDKTDMDSFMIDILTPYPNTKLYANFNRQGRILDTNWEHYDYRHVVYRPLRMTVDQLIDGYLQLYQSLAHRKFSFKKLLHVYKENGLNTGSTVVVATKLYFRFDANKKARALRKNQTDLKLLSNFDK
jgi:radical SAM superfamily enzyme YgiQ (UPF0313 family)